MIEEKKIGNCCLQGPDLLIQPAKYKHQTDKGEGKNALYLQRKKKGMRVRTCLHVKN